MEKTAAVKEEPKPDEASKSKVEPEAKPAKEAEGETTIFKTDDGILDTASKRQSKRALKKERKRAEWLANKGERRAKEREKRRLKRERKTRENDYELSYSASRKRLKEATMAASACRVGVVVDMSFDHLMHQRDLGKCCKQLLHCYSINRRLADPMQFHVTGIKEGSRGEAEMAKHEGYRNWDAHFHAEDYDAALPKDKVVYLSSESENVLSDLEPEKYYVIGGLVDHNAHKGLVS